MLTVTEVEALFPAKSVAVPLMICPAPSLDTRTGAGQTATPEVISEHVNVIVTLELFHPAALAAGGCDCRDNRRVVVHADN